LSDCTFQFKNQLFKIQGILDYRRAKGREIEIRISKDGKIRVFLAHQEISVIPLNQALDTPPILSRKEVLSWKTRAHKQPPSHPWKKYGYQLTRPRPNIRVTSRHLALNIKDTTTYIQHLKDKT
jgi:hypothetical protein